jgi:hypothetical protein
VIGRSALAGCVALAALASVSGCNTTDATPLWRDDFESVCDGAPCGWTQVAGPAGAAVWIETAAGEHGAQMTGPGVAIARTAAGDEVIGSDPVSSLKAHVVARCDTGSQLTLIVTVQNVAGGAPIDVSGSATFPSTWDGSRTTFDLFADDGANSSAQFVDILDVVLHKEGTGTCEVDYVSLADDSVRFFE